MAMETPIEKGNGKHGNGKYTTCITVIFQLKPQFRVDFPACHVWLPEGIWYIFHGYGSLCGGGIWYMMGKHILPSGNVT